MPSLFGPQNRTRVLFFAIWTVVFVGIAALFRGVLLTFFLAVVLAYVMAPLVEVFERRIKKRWVAVVVIYLQLLGAIALFMALGVPRIVVEIEKLAREAPRAVAIARDEWLPAAEARLRLAMAAASEDGPEEPPTPSSQAGGVTGSAAGRTPRNVAIMIQPTDDGGYAVHLPPSGIVIEPEGERFRIREAEHVRGQRDVTSSLTHALRGLTENTEETAVTILRTAQHVAARVVKGVFTFFIVLMLSAYLLITKDQVIGFFRALVRRHKQQDYDELLQRIDKGLSGVVRGQLMICLINGVLSGIGFYALGLRYWPILTLLATVLSIIPIFGAILSSVPAVIVGLQQGVGVAAAVLAWIVIIHQVEANLLNPKIMGDAASLHPVLIVLALLGGEHAFGIAGALFAVPVLSILQSLFLHYREQALGVPKRETAPGTA